jgi:hypothetical protein
MSTVEEDESILNSLSEEVSNPRCLVERQGIPRCLGEEISKGIWEERPSVILRGGRNIPRYRGEKVEHPGVRTGAEEHP